MKDAYRIVVHVVNLLLLAGIGFLTLGLFINISESGGVPNFSITKIGYIIILLILWVINYWYQLKRRKWILPIIGTTLFIGIAAFLLGVVVRFLNQVIYP